MGLPSPLVHFLLLHLHDEFQCILMSPSFYFCYLSYLSVLLRTPTMSSQQTFHVTETLATHSEYMSESEHYLTSNTAMVFLPGEHTLQDSITTRSISKAGVYIYAEVSKIICTDATFTFQNILNHRPWLSFLYNSASYFICTL